MIGLKVNNNNKLKTWIKMITMERSGSGLSLMKKEKEVIKFVDTLTSQENQFSILHIHFLTVTFKNIGAYGCLFLCLNTNLLQRFLCFACFLLLTIGQWLTKLNKKSVHSFRNNY